MNSTLLLTEHQEEYSDLFAVSGTSFLSPEDQTADNQTSNLIQLTQKTKTNNNNNNNNDLAATPTNIIDQSISAFDILPAALTPSTPSSRKNKPPKISSHHTQASTWASTNLPRTQSVDLVALHLQETPRATMPRSKSTTSVLNSPRTAHPTKVTKSILKRPNSPSKRARARFFSPSLVSSESSQDDLEPDLPDWVDQNGNLKAREIIHEFQHDQPPNIRPNKPFHQSSSSMSHKPPTPFTPPKVTTTSAYTRSRRHSHTPRFTIPEPIDLGIEPILPRRSTSPSPSPPSLPPSSYLIDPKPRQQDPPAREPENQQDSNRSTSTSLIFNTSENLSNILDQSGGFLVGNDTTLTTADSKAKDCSTEHSIDLNHVAMLEILAKKNALNRPISFSGLRGLPNKSNPHMSRCVSVPEEEDESVDVCGLAKQLEDTECFPLGNPALNDEQAPLNLQGSLDFSTTFESSTKLNLPPLLTDEEEIWKNSIPKKKQETEKEKSKITINGNSKFVRPKTKSMSNFDTLVLSKKIEGINLTNQEQHTRFQTRDDLFSELMSIQHPPSSYSRPPKPVASSGMLPVKNVPSTRPSTRPSTANSRLSGPIITFPSKTTNKPGMASGSPISRPRTSFVSTSRVPLGPRRGSNIGIGMPSSSSVPNITKLTSRTPVMNTNTAITGNRTKLKPSNAIVKPPHSIASSPKLVMKNRSSISNQNLNSCKLHLQSPPKTKPSGLSCHPPLISPTPSTSSKMPIKPTLRSSSILNLPTPSLRRRPPPSSSSSTYSSRLLYHSAAPNHHQIKKKNV